MILFRKIRSKFNEKIFKYFIFVALNLNFPWLFAWSCIHLSRAMNSSVKQGKILLVHESRGGIKEIDTMIERATKALDQTAQHYAV